MRDLVRYPVTLTEVIECLERIMVEKINEDESVGDMTPTLIKRAIQIVKREQFFYGD